MSFRLEHPCAPSHKFPAAATPFMNSSAPTANKLPPWIFYLLDAVLTAVAVYIAYQAPKPLSTQTIFVVTALVLGGALLLAGVLVARYEREKNEALDDRQRALEALARTLTTAAEQISIATAGLNDIADLTQKNLKKAEQLPAQLQEKVAELASRLVASEADTLDALENELASLRALESERLAATAEKINQTVTQLGQLAVTTHLNLTAARESLAHLGANAAQHFAELDTATTAAIAKAQTAAAESLAGAHSRATAAIEEKLTASLGTIDAKLARLTTQLGTQVDSAATTLDTKLAALLAASRSEFIREPAPTPAAAAPLPPDEPTAGEAPSAPAVSESPKRTRKSRREEPAPAEPAGSAVSDPPPTVESVSGPVSADPDSLAPAISVVPQITVEPTPPADVPAAIESGAFDTPPTDIVTAAPFFYSSPFSSERPTPAPLAEQSSAPNASSELATADAEDSRSARKRSSKQSVVTELAPEPTLEAVLAPDVEIPAPAREPEIAPAPGPDAITNIAAIAPVETAVAAPAVETLPAPPAAEVPSDPTEPIAFDAPVPTEPVDEFVQFSPDELPAAPAATPEFKLHSPDATVSSMTADGATRLLATAYIGIGNRLFIRGEGPGLTWEKGVPLQFVSIGKWRWETTEANAPIAFKLYKNDTVECTALGEQSITPGHLTEVTAAF